MRRGYALGFNAEHPALLDYYLQAGLRERTPNVNRSVVSRLPHWIKRAKNRQEVLRGIELLKQRLQQC